MCLRLVFLHGFPAKRTQKANNGYLSDAERYSRKPGETTQLQIYTYIYIYILVGGKKHYLFIFSVQLSHSGWCNGKGLNISAACCCFLNLLYSRLFPPRLSRIAVAITSPSPYLEITLISSPALLPLKQLREETGVSGSASTSHQGAWLIPTT